MSGPENPIENADVSLESAFKTFTLASYPDTALPAAVVDQLEMAYLAGASQSLMMVTHSACMAKIHPVLLGPTYARAVTETAEKVSARAILVYKRSDPT